jgi:hypothetical protein
MPKHVAIKTKSGDPIQISAPNSFNQNTSITTERVFEEPTGTKVVKKIVLDGSFVGVPSGTEIEVINGDCNIGIEYDEP